METFFTVVWIITLIYAIYIISSVHAISRNMQNETPLSIGGGVFFFIANILTAGIYGIYWLYKADNYVSGLYRTYNKPYRECHPIAWYFFGSIIIIGPFVAFTAIRNRFEEVSYIKEESIKREAQKIADEHKKCPFCAETIKKEAIFCRFCGKDMPKEEELKTKVAEKSENSDNKDAEIQHWEKLFDETTDETEKGIIAKKLYDLGKIYYWRFIPRVKQ